MMKLKKIKDNNPKISIDELNEIPELTKKITNKTLRKIEKEGILIFPDTIENSKDLSQDQMVLQHIDGEYRSSNVMGFLGYKNERLIINSRFSNYEQDYFLQYLLSKVLDIPSNIFDLNTNSSTNNKLLNLIIFFFPYYLKIALRKGIFKTYIKNQYNNSNIKGTVDISHHIKTNTPFIGNIAYNQREFSHDNYLVQLIRHTIEFIKTKPFGNHLLNRVNKEVLSIIDSTSTYKYEKRSSTLIKKGLT